MTGRSPMVEELSWGEITVEGEGAFRDVKLWPGGARGWDWEETGTSHVPGIQIADVEEIVEHSAERVILSRGQNRRLQVEEETLAWLSDHDIETEVLESNAAVERYNKLAEDGAPVGALIHTTC